MTVRLRTSYRPRHFINLSTVQQAMETLDPHVGLPDALDVMHKFVVTLGARSAAGDCVDERYGADSLTERSAASCRSTRPRRPSMLIDEVLQDFKRRLR